MHAMHAMLAASVRARTSMLVCCLAAVGPPMAEQACRRPTIDDVERISWGRSAKQKGTGSRGVPHRLNADERRAYDSARSKGFVEIGGSGWRRERSASPLVNTYRSWCDARAVPAIFVHKDKEGDDEVVVDLSPLRTPAAFEAAAAYACASVTDGADGSVEAEQWGAGSDVAELDAAAAEDLAEAAEGAGTGEARFDLSAETLAAAYLSDPIYRLPMYALVWRRPRSVAKALAKALAASLCTVDQTLQLPKGRTRDRGAPEIKPGKSRQHGGYGIG